MSYYNIQKNVEQYIQMAEGYDGKLLIDVLGKHLPEGSTVLELGMGPGKDLMLLGEKFNVTGSDVSPLFLERFKASNPDADLLQLDAVTMKTDRKFDCIYSNKVLYHLTQEQLIQSLKQQLQALKPNGLAHHSFWYGEGSEEMHGLQFTYYTEEKLQEIIGESYDIVEMQRYTEMDEDDSIYILLRKHN
ncbi:MAG: class I SAM-dependent methyltransferase [Aggregatilineales bacterium]